MLNNTQDMKGLILLLIPLLLVSALPVYATNNSLPQGASVDLSFSPSRIPLGYGSTLSITFGAEETGTDLYIVTGIQFEDWLRWETSDIKLGNFLYGGVVLRTDNQLFGSNFLQIGGVVPKGNYITVQVPVTPTRTGIFYLHEVIIITLPVIDGDFVLTPGGYSYQGFTYSILQFDNKLTVYDPLLPKILDNQEQMLDSVQAVSSQLSNATNDLGLLTSLVNVGFQGTNSQYATLISLYEKQTDSLLYQVQLLVRVLWLLVGTIMALGGYLIWREIATYRLSKTRT